jgi:hypothetical protein
MTMKPRDVLTTTRPIRSQKTGLVLPRQGIFLGTIENLGASLVLVDFGSASLEYLFPNEIMAQTAGINQSFATAFSNQ